MPGPADPRELFPSLDPSAEFGRNEGVIAYFRVAGDHPDWSVEQIALQAVRLQMIISNRLDVRDLTAVDAIIRELDSEVGM